MYPRSENCCKDKRIGRRRSRTEDLCVQSSQGIAAVGTEVVNFTMLFPDCSVDLYGSLELNAPNNYLYTVVSFAPHP